MPNHSLLQTQKAAPHSSILNNTIMKNLQPKYENRLVAFIDILGFSNLIQISENEPGRVPWLINILNAIKSNEGIKERFGEDLDVRMEFTAFSDCFVLSSRIPEDPVNTALYQIALICFLLLRSGLFARGAIVEGHLFHRNNIVFGPGMLDAYTKEQKEAIYPRVIVSSNIIKRYYREIKVPEVKKIVNKWSSTLLRSDNDNNWYIDTIFSVPFSLKNANEKEDIQLIKTNVEKQIEENKNNTDILNKYVWFKGYFNNIAEEHPEFCIQKIE